MLDYTVVRKPYAVIRALAIEVSLLILVSCTKPHESTLAGTIVPASEHATLQAKYDLEIEARRGELELRIQLPKTTYTSEETISFTITLTNTSENDVVVLKPDAKTNRIDAYTGIGSEITFMVVPSDPTISLNFPAPAAPYPGSLITLPEDFTLLNAGNSYLTSITMPRPISPMPEGIYSVSITYRNYRFGADYQDASGELFVDYHAWMGEIESNTVTFDIVP